MRFQLGLWIAALLLGIAASGPGAAFAQSGAEGATLTPFASDRALRNFLRAAIAEERRQNMAEYGAPYPPPPPPPPPPPSPPPPPPGAAAQPAALSITNNQIVGVDEGDIVKARGDILVILRRGRLFTVSLAGGTLRPVAAIDAFPPGTEARGDWYDEMLISGDRVVVIGYSYRRTGTQVNRFRIGADGSLAFEDSYALRSGDYYSSRNYASRLIGSRLILYSPLGLNDEGDVLDSLPAIRQWQANAAGGGSWRRTAGANNVYVPSALTDVRRADISMLHTVTACDLEAAVLDCDSTVVLGGYARTFFVSGNAVYLWIGNAWKEDRGSTAFVYRIPFDGGRPQALQARGMPVDQFSFHPDPARSALHVVVRAEGDGDAMWSPEVTGGDTALLSIPMRTFGTGALEVPRENYHKLPPASGSRWSFQNRFVGDHLLYGTASSDITGGTVAVVSLADYAVTQLSLPHGVDRLDAIGADAIAIGNGRGALGFSAIALAGTPRVADTFLLPNAREGESRSHAFFFRPDPGSRDGSGLLGLPVARFLQRQDQPQGNSAGILFLSRREGKLSEAGSLNGDSAAGSDADDGCQASCADWYGNARPIFLGDRILALLGYEIVEGSAANGRVGEVGRTSFAPQRPKRD